MDPKGHHGLHPLTGGHLAHRNSVRSIGDPRNFSAWVGAIRSESEKKKKDLLPISKASGPTDLRSGQTL